MCQRFKDRNNIYVHLPTKNITKLKPWYLVHVYLVGPYSKSIRQQKPGGAIINNNGSLTCMIIIDPAIGWLEIVEVPTYDLDGDTGGNGEYIDK